MNNFRPFGPRDEISFPDQDRGFIGVEQRLPPQQLPPGYVAGARNKRFRNGRAATREGIGLLPWMKVDGSTPFDEVYGGAVFNDPNQSGQWILIAADGGVWKTRPNLVAQSVPLPPGVTLTADTFKKFIQANSAIILLRGLDEDPLQCTNLEEGFKPIVQTNIWDMIFDAATNRVQLSEHNLLTGDPMRFSLSPSGGTLPVGITADKTYYMLTSTDADSFQISDEPGGSLVTWNTSDTDATTYSAQVTLLDGAEPIPPAVAGIFILNRLLLINGKDTCVVSDIGDFTRYQPVAQEFRINQGDSFTLVSLALYNEDTVVFFKDGKVAKVIGIRDLSSAVGPLNVTESYGAAADQAVATYGKEIYWLTNEARVSTLTLTALNQEQGTNNALSDPLVETFGRINGTYQSAARVAIYNGFLHVALPFDDARLLSRTELVDPALTGSNMVPGLVHGLTVGQKYAYVQGEFGDHLVNGTETLYGDADFIAQGGSVALWMTAAGQMETGASIVEVIAEGCNTGVAVYDFLNQAWAGTDEADNVTVVKDWLKFTLGGQERLGFIGADGWLHLYYEGCEDELYQEITPYVDILADRLSELHPGATLRVNSGTIVTAAFNALNAGLTWGIGGGNAHADAPENLWEDSAGNGGYNPDAIDPWTQPDCTPSEIEGGVRFISTDGNPVSVIVNGTLVSDGFSEWAFVDAHPGPYEILSVGISDWVRTRAYLCRRDLEAASKRFLQMAAQIGTWCPNYTISAVTPGVQTLEAYAEDQTRDRLKYFSPHDKEDWVPTNENNDFDAPRREDYSWTDNGLGIWLGTGVAFDQVQEYVHRVATNEHGVWMQLDLANSDGRLELLAVALESQDGEVLSGPKVN